MDRTIKRGDIFYAELNPVVGSEQGGTRPVLIISELCIDGMPDASHNKEYCSDSRISQNRTFVVSENR